MKNEAARSTPLAKGRNSKLLGSKAPQRKKKGWAGVVKKTNKQKETAD
jgi:hypothetical protein